MSFRKHCDWTGLDWTGLDWTGLDCSLKALVNEDTWALTLFKETYFRL